ncbi:InlB B-repeat-containing protein [Bacillus cereus]|uniref:InlB B-repeat-containing protein n=1 Tax=Bacillus cereus TaxID=1396 RepID=UPI002112470E|nr:InlB B-repeat-containing protein [Bacillus cereus]
MWGKSKRVVVSSILSLFFIGNTVALATVNHPTQTQENENVARNYVKVSYENKVLFHEQVPSQTMIQVLNEKDDVVESMVVTSDKDMHLEKPKMNSGKMLSYWTIEMKDGKLRMKPVLTTKQELFVTFYVKDAGGSLVENHKQIKEVVKSATKDEKLKDILPDVNPDRHYKFTGWFEIVDTGDGKKVEEKLQGMDDKKITDSTGVYYAKFYSDLNNNGIDDTTEEITVNFVTNIEEQIEPVTLHVGQRMQTPKLSHTDKVFMGWYTNPALTNKFDNDNMRDSITLYAKWENSEKVINESEKVPIIDKDVSDQVEKMLQERFKKGNEEKINRENPNETKTEVPNQVATGTTDNTNANKGVATNNNQKSDTHNTNPNTNHANPVASNPLGGSLQNGTKGKENGTSNSANSNKITAYTETKYVFKNKHIGEKYMVKFLDESGAFVSSLTLPYGRTIKLIDENEKAHEEYAVRQDTTITLDTERYVNKGSTFLGLDTRTVQVNATEITEIVPTTAKNSANSFLYKQEKKGEQKKEKHTSIWMMVCSGIAVVGIMIGIFFFLKKRKQKEKVQIKNPNL